MTGDILGLAEPGSDAPGSAGNSPLFGTDDSPVVMPFAFDDDVDDDVPILRLGDDDEDAPHPIPTFQLDSDDDVDDDVPIPDTLPGANLGPVFDLSSELENQLPRPLVRPNADELPTMNEPPVMNEPPLADTAPVDVAPAMSAGGGAALSFETPNPMSSGLVDPFAETPSVPVPALPGFVPPTLMTPGQPSAVSDTGSQAPATQEEMFRRQIFDAMLPTLLELVAEIRRSLEYYTSREPETPIQHVLVYGGTSRLPNLAEFFGHELGIEVRNADPVSALDLSAFCQPQEYLHDLAPALPICIGLGLRDMIE